jgi:signal transduction histidine kinase
MTVPLPDPATRAAPHRRVQPAAPVLSTVLVLAGIVARAVGRVVPGLRSTAVRRARTDAPLKSVTEAPTHAGVRDGAMMDGQDVSTVRNLLRARDEWASIVAHELRQPISAIALRSSLLLRGQLSSEQRDCVAQIARSIHSLGRMVTDLMDASLLESDRLRVTLTRVDLGQLLTEIVRRTPLAAPRTRTHLPGDVCLFVKGDAQRLEQVIANLLSNAIKYATPDTDVMVDLRVAAGQAHIRVSNDGDPIPQDELPFIFNRFARTQAAGASGVTGLGLGLYIARGLVSAHHGRIWAESGPAGTTFHVTLPLDGPPVLLQPPSAGSFLPLPEGGRHDTAAAPGRSRTVAGLSACAGTRRTRTARPAERLPDGRL